MEIIWLVQRVQNVKIIKSNKCNQCKGSFQKKIRDYLGIFPKWRTLEFDPGEVGAVGMEILQNQNGPKV